jgi:anti-sigma-K factor RskA
MRFSLGVSKLHMVLVGSYFILFATYLIIVWRGWKKITPVSVANILPNGADAVMVAMFGAGTKSTTVSTVSTVSTASTAFLAPNVAQGAVAPGAGAAISAISAGAG